MKPIRLILVIAFSCSAFTAVAQDLLKSQPPVWAGQPDITALEKLENKHLAPAQSSIDAIIAIKGLRTIANTLAAYDAARHINSAVYLAGLMEQVHPDSTLRDHAMAMLRNTCRSHEISVTGVCPITTNRRLSASILRVAVTSTTGNSVSR